MGSLAALPVTLSGKRRLSRRRGGGGAPQRPPPGVASSRPRRSSGLSPLFLGSRASLGRRSSRSALPRKGRRRRGGGRPGTSRRLLLGRLLRCFRAGFRSSEYGLMPRTIAPTGRRVNGYPVRCRIQVQAQKHRCETYRKMLSGYDALPLLQPTREIPLDQVLKLQNVLPVYFDEVSPNLRPKRRRLSEIYVP